MERDENKTRRLRLFGLLVISEIFTGIVIALQVSKPLAAITLLAFGVVVGSLFGDFFGGRKGSVIGAVFAFLFLVLYGAFCVFFIPT